MNWFDGLVIALAILVVVFEARQEAGRALLDALFTVVAFQMAGAHEAALTRAFHWPVLPGTEAAPTAYAILFGTYWAVGLGCARLIHGRTRWSMDHFDPLCGLAFGLLIAVAVGHVFADVSVRLAMQNPGGEVPAYIAQSRVTPELREFRSYHQLVAWVETARRYR
jgi:hypothetical protein